MERLRDQLLPGAALALDEDGAARGSDADQRIEERANGGRGADEARAAGRLQAARDLVRVGDRVPDFALELRNRNRFLQHRDGAEAHRLDAGRH